MSSPREAVYDVLMSKAARARRQKARDDAQAAWEKYELSNRTAHGTYMAQRSDGKHNGRAKTSDQQVTS